MKSSKLWLATILGAQLAFISQAAENAEPNRDADVEVLKQQLRALTQKVQALESQRAADQQAADDAAKTQNQELDQKIRILARQRELDQEAAVAAAKKQPQLKLDASGFTVSSADTNFSLSLHGLLQLDNRTFLQNAQAGKGGFFLRRARPILSGTVFRDFDYVFMPDFGGSSSSSTPVIQDAYINYRYQPGFQFRTGKFKTPVGLEFLQSTKDNAFNEYTLVKDLGPGRDLGAEVLGDLFDGGVSYAAGIFNGVADGSNASNGDFDNHPDFAGRLFFQPWIESGAEWLNGLGFGVGGTYGDQEGTSAVNKYTTDGLQTFFQYRSGVAGAGQHWRISPQGYYYHGPFGLLAEYIESSQKVATGANSTTLNNSAWEVTGSWILTGENNSYKGVKPDENFDPAKGHWGAWGLFARYAQLDVDSAAFPIYADPNTSASSADAWSVGLSWWLNKNIRVLTSFSRTTFSGGGNGTITKEPEEVLFTRVQLAF